MRKSMGQDYQSRAKGREQTSDFSRLRIQISFSPMKLKRNPFSLLRNVDNLIDAGKLKSKPAWYDAMSLYPMAPQPSPYVSGRASGHFDSKEKCTPWMAQLNSKRSKKPPALQWIDLPPEIRFPEDEIREAFYRVHPFELLQPKSLIESSDSLEKRDWSTILGGNRKTPLSGERWEKIS